MSKPQPPNLSRRWRAREFRYEVLEPRNLLAAIRLANWNVDNGPNTATDDQNFETVISAIGQEVIQGASRALDVLVLSETDSSSAAQLEDVFDNLYSTSDYENVFSTADGGGDRTGFIYNSQTVSLLDTFELNESTLTHHILRGQFRPINATAAEDFFVYAIHLKSGSSSADENIRAAEAEIIRNDADLLGSNANVIYAGDFNLGGSSEAVWSTITASGNGSAFDAANAPGEWSENPAFSQWHTHSVSQVDDRFDLQFISDELTDGVGLDYVENSIHVFGNDGSHNFNDSIETGTGASPEVLSALASVSDHLPVVADFEIVTASPGVIIVPSSGSTTVAEGGNSDSYEISLRTEPTDVVTLTVVPGSQLDLGAGAGNSIILDFSVDTTLTHTITVSAVDDLFDEGTHSDLIQHFLTSTDTDYDQLEVDDVSVTIEDNDSLLTQPLLNEIFVNPPGADDNREFIEILGPANSSLADVWLLEVEGDGSNAGIIDNAVNLSNLNFGSNGLLLLGEDYLTSNPWLRGLSPETTIANLVNSPIENGTISFLLVEQFTATAGFDLDGNNDGVIDNSPWASVFDSVGWTDGGASDHVYAGTILSQTGVPDAASRIPGNFDVNSADAWYNGDVIGSGTDRSYGNNVSSNLPDGAVITPGFDNFFPFAAEVPAESFAVLNGTIGSGGVPELQFTDNTFLQIYSAVAQPVVEAAIVVDFQAFIPDFAPDSITFVLESRVSTPNVEQQVELFNFATQEFEVADVQAASTLDDSVEVILSGELSEYVNQSTGELRAKASWTTVGPVLGFPWSLNLDQVAWQVNLVESGAGNLDLPNYTPNLIATNIARAPVGSDSIERSDRVTLTIAPAAYSDVNLEAAVIETADSRKPLGEYFRNSESLKFGLKENSNNKTALIDAVFEFELVDWPNA